MKKLLISFALFFLFLTANSQTSTAVNSSWDFVSETAVSAGFGMGGNSIFGADLEVMVLPRFSAQLGAGFWGFSGGINYHIYPTVSSSFFSFQAWQSGFGNRYKAIYAGPSFQYRANKLFQAGIGVGYQINKSPNYNPQNKALLTVNLGIYFPL
ncbi:exported hypothetical protein [uncultured Paludibacter sp.]|uniref:Outer membrane protein beta-barrel domain-containing protein n=1 Tax=uncultured Paludibacter sp. TaxID=497635 RepID=A0A653AJU4_9BACT|nr:exported hypothetical protein [uncultured Paludibacter sp.]